MNNPYESPKANLDKSFQQPSKIFLHITFWVGHILVFIYIFSALYKEELTMLEFVFLMLGCIFLFAYFFAIGIYMSKLRRSGVTWGGLSFLFSPIGLWISYIASFFVGPKPIKSK